MSFLPVVFENCLGERAMNSDSSDGNGGISPTDLLRLYARMRKLRRAVAGVSKAEECVCDAAQELSDCVGDIMGKASLVPKLPQAVAVSAGRRRVAEGGARSRCDANRRLRETSAAVRYRAGSVPGPPSTDSDTRLRTLAENGTDEFELAWQSDDRALVRIGSAEPFRLSPRLGQLLLVLISGEVCDQEGLVRYKNWDEACERLAKLAGRPVTRHALHNLSCRLRKELDRHGVNRHLVQTSGRRGVRLAWRRPPGVPPAAAGAA